MKKNVAQIIIFIAFILFVLGSLLDPIMFKAAKTEWAAKLTSIGTVAIAAILCLAFVNCKNGALLNVGYGLSALIGVDGLVGIIAGGGIRIARIGEVLFLIAAIVYLVILLIRFAGYVKGNGSSVAAGGKGDIAITLNSYKDMEAEKVITAEEFDALKAKALSGVSIEAVGDLKKWKKLLDQKVITEEEFASLKEKLFK